MTGLPEKVCQHCNKALYSHPVSAFGAYTWRHTKIVGADDPADHLPVPITPPTGWMAVRREPRAMAEEQRRAQEREQEREATEIAERLAQSRRLTDQVRDELIDQLREKFRRRDAEPPATSAAQRAERADAYKRAGQALYEALLRQVDGEDTRAADLLAKTARLINQHELSVHSVLAAATRHAPRPGISGAAKMHTHLQNAPAERPRPGRPPKGRAADDVWEDTHEH